MPVGIVTDSACDLPPELARTEGVVIVPLEVRLEGHSTDEMAGLSGAAFWAGAGSPTSNVAASRASKMRFTDSLPSDSYLPYCVPSYLGCRTNFCTRQDSISPTISWSGLRQSIACTTWNPGASLPA